MKYPGLILVLALVTGQVLSLTIHQRYNEPEDSLSRKTFDEKFYDFLENLKFTLRQGNDTLGIPRVDPFDEKDLNVTLNEEQVTGTARFQNLHVAGLSEYTINKAKLAILSREITIGLTWPKIYAESLYKLNASLLQEFHVFGDGNFTMTLKDLTFLSVVKFSIIGGVRITNMDTEILLGGVEFVATGIFDDAETSDLISQVVSDIAPSLVITYQDDLTKIVNKKVTEIANEQLKDKSLSDLLQLLG